MNKIIFILKRFLLVIILGTKTSCQIRPAQISISGVVHPQKKHYTVAITQGKNFLGKFYAIESDSSEKDANCYIGNFYGVDDE